MELVGKLHRVEEGVLWFVMRYDTMISRPCIFSFFLHVRIMILFNARLMSCTYFYVMYEFDVFT